MESSTDLVGKRPTDFYEAANHLLRMPAPSYKQFVLGCAKPMATLADDLIHMAIGISGETAELLEAHLANDPSNVREELGDIVFYCYGMHAQQMFPDQLPLESMLEAKKLKHKWVGLAGPGNDMALGQLLCMQLAAGDLLDQCKKVWCYNKQQWSDDVIPRLACYQWLLNDFALHLQDCGITDFVNIMQHNVDKLSKRYEGGKYSDAAALERVDKQLLEAGSGEQTK